MDVSPLKFTPFIILVQKNFVATVLFPLLTPISTVFPEGLKPKQTIQNPIEFLFFLHFSVHP